jgi:hypothetical protein
MVLHKNHLFQQHIISTECEQLWFTVLTHNWLWAIYHNETTETLLTIPRIRGLHGNRLEITTLLKSHNVNLTQGMSVRMSAGHNECNNNKKHGTDTSEI